MPINLTQSLSVEFVCQSFEKPAAITAVHGSNEWGDVVPDEAIDRMLRGTE